ncbi:1526_t:CDS:2 [Racocetra fulgida]|uniref:1526_t:CDS:1 n=1 Tax=Racocetra fulgida TaxID=60492 RepID=A0A9N9GU18_9GLOM|nr:1526_t:CDS:2 [Racocetra fulgida]
MEHITVEYYHASTPYLSPEAIKEIIQSRGTVKNACRKMAYKYSTSTCRIYEIWKRHAEGIPLCKQQLIHSVVFSEIMSKNNTLDKKSKKRKSGFANKVDITDILIKKVDEMDDLRVKLAQNRKKREEAKREMKR